MKINQTWTDPYLYYGMNVPKNALVGDRSTIIFPELITMQEPARLDSGVYISVALDMADHTVVCHNASVIGGADRKVTMGRWSFIGWHSVVMARSEKYEGLVGVGFGAPGPAVEGDVIFEDFSGVATNCIVYPGVRLPEGALVGDGSRVYRSEDLRPWWVHRMEVREDRLVLVPWKERDKDRVLREAEEVGQ